MRPNYTIQLQLLWLKQVCNFCCMAEQVLIINDDDALPMQADAMVLAARCPTRSRSPPVRRMIRIWAAPKRTARLPRPLAPLATDLEHLLLTKQESALQTRMRWAEDPRLATLQTSIRRLDIEVRAVERSFRVLFTTASVENLYVVGNRSTTEDEQVMALAAPIMKTLSAAFESAVWNIIVKILRRLEEDDLEAMLARAAFASEKRILARGDLAIMIRVEVMTAVDEWVADGSLRVGTWHRGTGTSASMDSCVTERQSA